MKKSVVVCVKQVPDVLEVKIDPETKTLVREGIPSILNPFDDFAVEEAVLMKERFGARVTVVSMGPPQVESALKRCIAMGADDALLLSDPLLSGSDTLATANALAAAIKKIPYDLIICGQETTDSSTAQVGPEVAEKLGIPQITFVSRVEIDEQWGSGNFTRETDTGYQIMSGSLPLLITVVKGINIPRGPIEPLDGEYRIMKLAASDLDIDISAVGLDGSPTQVVNIEASTGRKRAQMVIDSALPALDRVKLIMQGGIAKKMDSTIVKGGAGGHIDAIINFMKKHIFSE